MVAILPFTGNPVKGEYWEVKEQTRNIFVRIYRIKKNKNYNIKKSNKKYFLYCSKTGKRGIILTVVS